MASVKFGEDSREFLMFQEYWGLMKKYWIPESDDSYWEELIAETNQFAQKYGDYGFPRDLVMALVNELGRKSKNEQMQ